MDIINAAIEQKLRGSRHELVDFVFNLFDLGCGRCSARLFHQVQQFGEFGLNYFAALGEQPTENPRAHGTKAAEPQHSHPKPIAESAKKAGFLRIAVGGSSGMHSEGLASIRRYLLNTPCFGILGKESMSKMVLLDRIETIARPSARKPK
ncbi:MAG TPA: hypothetical protein VIQ05_29360 [Tardiphaga sp.]